MIKWPILKESIAILNLYANSNRASKHEVKADKAKRRNRHI